MSETEETWNFPLILDVFLNFGEITNEKMSRSQSRK